MNGSCSTPHLNVNSSSVANVNSNTAVACSSDSSKDKQAMDKGAASQTDKRRNAYRSALNLFSKRGDSLKGKRSSSLKRINTSADGVDDRSNPSSPSGLSSSPNKLFNDMMFQVESGNDIATLPNPTKIDMMLKQSMSHDLMLQRIVSMMESMSFGGSSAYDTTHNGGASSTCTSYDGVDVLPVSFDSLDRQIHTHSNSAVVNNTVGGLLVQVSELKSNFLSMEQALKSKDDEISALKSLVSTLTDRMERIETASFSQLDYLSAQLNQITSEQRFSDLQVTEVKSEMSGIQAKLRIVDEMDFATQIKCKGTFHGHDGPVWALAVFDDLLLSGSSDSTIKVWDTNNYKVRKTIREHRDTVLALLVNGGRCYSGSADTDIAVFEPNEDFKRIDTLKGHVEPVCTLAAVDNYLYSGSLKVIKIWDLTTHECIRSVTGLNHWVRAMVAKGNILYSGSYKSVSVWDIKTMECVETLDLPVVNINDHLSNGGSVYSIAVTAKFIIAGTYENIIHVWDADTFQHITTLTGHCGTVYDMCVSVSPDGHDVLFTASYDKTILVWHLEYDKFHIVQSLVRHTSSVDTVVMVKGKLFSGAADSTIKVWR